MSKPVRTQERSVELDEVPDVDVALLRYTNNEYLGDRRDWMRGRLWYRLTSDLAERSRKPVDLATLILEVCDPCLCASRRPRSFENKLFPRQTRTTNRWRSAPCTCRMRHRPFLSVHEREHAPLVKLQMAVIFARMDTDKAKFRTGSVSGHTC